MLQNTHILRPSFSTKYNKITLAPNKVDSSNEKCRKTDFTRNPMQKVLVRVAKLSGGMAESGSYFKKMTLFIQRLENEAEKIKRQVHNYKTNSHLPFIRFHNFEKALGILPSSLRGN